MLLFLLIVFVVAVFVGTKILHAALLAAGMPEDPPRRRRRCPGEEDAVALWATGATPFEHGD